MFLFHLNGGTADDVKHLILSALILAAFFYLMRRWKRRRLDRIMRRKYDDLLS